MTAAHSVYAYNVCTLEFRLPGDSSVYYPTAKWTHPNYTHIGIGADIAILVFDDGTFANWYRISTDLDDVALGTTIFVAGAGNRAYWNTGLNDWVEEVFTSGPVRYGSNTISKWVTDYGFTPNSFAYDLDPPATYGENRNYHEDQWFTSNECGLGTGDSGGPSFVNISGSLYVVGIHHGHRQGLSDDYGYGSESEDVCVPYWAAAILAAVPQVDD